MLSVYKEFTILLMAVLSCLSLQASEFKAPKTRHEYIIDSLKLKLSQQLEDTVRVAVLTNLGEKLAFVKPDQALKYAKEALDIAERNSRGKDCECKRYPLLSTLGIIYVHISDYKEALTYFLRSLDLQRKFKLKNHDQSATLSNIGVCYLYLKLYEPAEKYFIQAMNMDTFTKKKDAPIYIYNNLGVIKFYQHKYPEAIMYYKKAAKEGSILALGNLGEVYVEINKPAQATYYLRKALSLLDSVEDMSAIIECHSSLGKLYINERKFDAAAFHLLRAEKLSHESGVRISLDKIYKNIAYMYEKQKKFAEANHYLQRLQLLKDSIYEEKIVLQTTVMNAKFEIDQKNNQIQQLTGQKQIADAKANNQQIIRNMVISLSVLILLFCIFVIRNIVLKHHIKNKLLNEETMRIELQQQQAEKEIMKMSHENAEARYEILKTKTSPHFLFNSLSTLSSIIVKDQKYLALEFVQKFADLYRMILEITDTELVSLEQEMNIAKNFFYLQQVRFRHNIEMNITAHESLTDQLIPPFSIQMAIENAIKHNVVATGKKLVIDILIREDEVEIRNVLQKKYVSAEDSTHTGQRNIIDRYHILSDRIPSFHETPMTYIVRLPLFKKGYVHSPV